MHKGWHIGASLAAFLAFDTECWAEETSPYGVALDGIDVGAEIAEKGGLESPLVAGAGKAANVAGMGLDIHKANQNLQKKWQTGEKATMNDFVPYAVPLLLLSPAGETVLLAYGAYKLGSYAIDVYKRQQMASDTPVDPNQQWQQEVEAQKAAVKLADMVAAKASAERLKKAAESSDLNKIDLNNFHSDSFSVERNAQSPPTSASEKWMISSYEGSNEPDWPKECVERKLSGEGWATMEWQLFSKASDMKCAITLKDLSSQQSGTLQVECNASVIRPGWPLKDVSRIEMARPDIGTLTLTETETNYYSGGDEPESVRSVTTFSKCDEGDHSATLPDNASIRGESLAPQ